MFSVLIGVVLAISFFSAPVSGDVSIAQDAAHGIRCDDFPLFCVPLVGSASNDPLLSDLESPDSRALDAVSAGVLGVVRGLAADGSFFIGDPAAPIHFMTFQSSTCGHCWYYLTDELKPFIETYVLSGQATLRTRPIGLGSTSYSTNSTHAMVCAAEQGAFWEMESTLFSQAESLDPHEAFTLPHILDTAGQMGLDTAALESCIGDQRYTALLGEYRLSLSDFGIKGVPAALVSYGESGEWTIISRDYDTLVELTTQAQLK